jgi:hypothetical protein
MENRALILKIVLGIFILILLYVILKPLLGLAGDLNDDIAEDEAPRILKRKKIIFL